MTEKELKNRIMEDTGIVIKEILTGKIDPQEVMNEVDKLVANGSAFIKLDSEEEESHRQYAREHDPDSAQWNIYHPVCRDEWSKLGKKPKGVN